MCGVSVTRWGLLVLLHNKGAHSMGEARLVTKWNSDLLGAKKACRDKPEYTTFLRNGAEFPPYLAGRAVSQQPVEKGYSKGISVGSCTLVHTSVL